MPVNAEKALISHFVAQDFGLDLAHENAAFAPGSNPFATLSVLSNAIEMYDIGSFNDVTGYLQFILRYPENGGAITAREKVSEIFAAFPLGSRVEYGGQKVHVVSYSQPQAEPEEGFFKLVGRINYRAFLAR